MFICFLGCLELPIFFNKKLFFSQNSICLFRALDPHPPTATLFQDKVLKVTTFFSVCLLQSKICGASKHHEMARCDLPTYVLHALGHFWMFAVKITEWLFSLKSLGLWTPTYPQFGTKSQIKPFFFGTFPNTILSFRPRGFRPWNII